MDVHPLRSRLYVITPTSMVGNEALIPYVRALVEAGVGLVQYRAKDVSTRLMIEDCLKILRVTRPALVPLVVDDRVDVALAVGAEGVHVGVSDMPVAYARRLMGPHALVGATAPTPQLARQAEQGGASYVSVGPMYATATAPEKLPVGPERVTQVRSVCRLPICAIGGITEDTLGPVADARPDLVAVVTAISDAKCPGLAARRLVARIAELLPGEVKLQ
ncbi:MAG: thiamine phosphate synthase [Armatimonadota bacterium]